MKPLNILFLEPFFAGSHADFAKGFKQACRHAVTLETLPARFWKWRMRGAALAFIQQVGDLSGYDLIITTGMMDLADFRALAGEPLPPVWLYCHENQLDYPLSPGEKRDFHLGFTSIVSALSADRVIFNSHSHKDAFFSHAQSLIKKMPDTRPDWALSRIRDKSGVIYPGCRFDPGPPELAEPETSPPLIVWNHRWEHDKNPKPFFAALENLKQKDIPFSLALMGENFSKAPAVFERAEKQFENQLKVFGYVASKQDYLSWLKKGAVVVSSAVQENFGISVVEAVRHGCIPLLPQRLSYPELISESLHQQLLYESEADFNDKLQTILTRYDSVRHLRKELAEAMGCHAWANRIKAFEAIMPGQPAAPDTAEEINR